LPTSIDNESAKLYGNIATATHGETVPKEVLGDGDASVSFQSFKLKKSPVTFVPQAGAPNGAANTLQVRVDGVLWEEVASLYGLAGDEKVYTTSVNDQNEMFVHFGDGVSGARVTTGRANVVAAYRQGLGRSGNVKSATLTTLLDRPVGLKSVTNLASAEGGAEPESLSEARINAPNTVRTFARVVSLRDFEDAAREFPAIAKARAIVQWDGLEQVVHLTVAGDGGTEVIGQTKDNLVRDLNSRRDANRKLVVNTYQKVFVQVEAVILVDRTLVAEDVLTTATAALLDYFAFDNLNLGQPIHLSNVYKALQDVKGVTSVDINRLQFKSGAVGTSHMATTAPVQGHLRIFFTELASIEQPATDIIVTLGTGVV
jgi:predicted phage baseplate assembly protein